MNRSALIPHFMATVGAAIISSWDNSLWTVTAIGSRHCPTVTSHGLHAPCPNCFVRSTIKLHSSDIATHAGFLLVDVSREPAQRDMARMLWISSTIPPANEGITGHGDS